MDTRQTFLKGLLFVLFTSLITVHAKADDFVEGGLYYSTLTENTVQVVKPTSGKYEGDIIIPESVIYNGSKYKVTAIGDYAFQAAGVTSVTLPLTTITSIGEYAFNDCTGLTEFTLPVSITKIGRNAFYYCDKLKHLYVHSTDPYSYHPGTEAFSMINNGGNVCTLHVPTGCTAAYSADANFSKFTKVEEFDPPQIYNLWVSGTKVTSVNAPDILGNGAVSYDASTTTLTISGDITATGSSYDGYGIYSGIDNLNVQISAPSTITSDSYGMYFHGSPTAATITGSSLLTIKTEGNYSIGTGSSHLIIKDAHLNLTNQLGSPWYGTLTVQSSTIDISSTTYKGAICDFTDVTLTDCYIDIPDQGVYDTTDQRMEDKNGDVAKTVSIRPGAAPDYYDLYVAGKHVNSYNASDILGDGAVSYDASAKTLSISKSFSASGAGLESDIDNLTVQVAAPATITAAGNGMNFTKNTTITGSSLLTITSGTDAAIFADGADLSINEAHLSLSGLLKGSSGTLSVQSSTIDVTTTSSSSAISGWAAMTLTDCYIKSPEDCIYDTNDKEVEDTFGFNVKTVSIVPGSAPVKYDLYVAGTQVTSINAANILGDGVASYNASTNTLTIGGAISALGADLEGEGITSNVADLIVQVSAPTTITSENSGMYFKKNATITGSSLLTITSNSAAIAAYNADLTINEANMSLTGPVKGESNGTLTIQSSTVDINFSINTSAISGWDDLILTDCCIEIPEQGVYSTTNKRVEDEYGNFSNIVKIDLIKLANDLAFSDVSATATFSQSFTEPILSNPHSLAVTYSSSNAEVATVDENSGEVTLVSTGTATITASFAGDETYKAGDVSYELTVDPKTVDAPTIILSKSSFVYDGQSKEPTVTVKDGSTVISAAEYNVTYTGNIDVGTATVAITDIDGGNYIVSGSTTFAIIAADGSLNPPVGITGLVYNGTAQDLIVEGSSTTGDVVYSLDGTVYDSALPMGCDAGEYTVYYKVSAYSGYKDIDPASFKVTIAPKTVTTPTILLSETSFEYDGNAKEPFVWKVMDGEMVIPFSEFTIGYKNNINVGIATVTITDNEGGNYIVSGSTTFSIAASDGSLTPPLGISGLSYTGAAQDLIEAGSSNTGTMLYSLDGTNYDTAIPQGKDAKVYLIYYKVVAKEGYKDIDPESFYVTIAPKAVVNPTITLSKTSFIYDGQPKEPTVTVKDGETTIPPSEYTIDYIDNIEVGLATVVINDNEGGNYEIYDNMSFTIISGELSLEFGEDPVIIDGQTLYELPDEIAEAIKETIQADIALPLEAETENRVEITEDGGLKFSKGENMYIGLLGLEQNDIVKFVFTGKLYGDGSKLHQKNAGTRTSGDLELVSDVEYEVVEDGDMTVVVALEEAECTLTSIIVKKAKDATPDNETITISGAKQVPYFCEYNLDFTDKPELKAYVATGYDKTKGTIWLTRVKQVPAETGFLLMGEPGDYDIPVIAGTSDCYYKNMFKGTLEGTTIQTTEGDYTNYYLSKGTSGVGFYKVTSADGQKIGANRCYLPILTDIPANGSEGDTEVIKVSAAKQVPYYTSKNIDFTSLDAQGVKAYTATGYNYGTGVIWLTRVKKVPAQTGILVMADKEGEYSVPTTSVQSVYENMFTGSETAQTIYTTEEIDGITYINYYLSNGESGVGFYKVTKEDGVKMSANRSYLQIPKREKVSGIRGMSDDASFCKMIISDNDDDVIAIPVYAGDATSISDVHQRVGEQEVYYNLQGLRVDNPGKGLYIKNGRVVVIK